MALIKYIIIVFTIFSVSGAKSYEVVEICATYLSTTKKYKIEASIYKGSELNKKTKSFNFNSFGKYVVIFWAKNEATVIELDSNFGPSPFGTTGKDRYDRRWSVSTSTGFCY